MTDTGITVTANGNDYNVAPPFTNRELHIIKQVSGVRAGELFDAMEAGDMDLLVALAHIGVRRSGAGSPTLDDLWDMEAGAITITPPPDEVTDPADPTPAAPDSGSPATTP